MEEQSKALPILPCKTQERLESDQLIREWLFRFGIEHKEDVAPRLPVWLEAFGGIKPKTLEALFQKALRSCKFFPKVSDILAPLETAKQAALPEEASEAWQEVLAIRRQHYNPDFPEYLRRAVACLPERVQRAARAAGVFQEFSDPDGLHTWAKKRFIESFENWNELEENEFLLPDGEVKALFTDLAERKALPAPVERQFPYTPAIAAERRSAEATPKPQTPVKAEARKTVDFDGRGEELKRQAKLILEKYGPSEARAVSEPKESPAGRTLAGRPDRANVSENSTEARS